MLATTEVGSLGTVRANEIKCFRGAFDEKYEGVKRSLIGRS